MLTVVLLLLVGSIFAESKPLEGIETPLLGGNLYAWVFTGEGLPQRVIGELPLLKTRGVGSKLQGVDKPVPVKGLGISGGSSQDSGVAQGLQNVVRHALFGPNARNTLGGTTGTSTISSAGFEGIQQRPGLGGAVSGVVGPVRGGGLGVPGAGGFGIVSGLPFNNAVPSTPVLGFAGVEQGQILQPIGVGGPLGGSSGIGILRALDGSVSGVAVAGPVRSSELGVPVTGSVVSALPVNNAVSPVGLIGVEQGQIVRPGGLGAPLIGGLPVGSGLLRGLGDGIQIGETGVTGNNIEGTRNPFQARELIYYPSDPSYLYPNTFNYGNSMYTLIPYNYGGIGYPHGSYISGNQNQAVA